MSAKHTPGPWRLYRPEGFAILSEDAIIGVAHHGKERAAIDTRVISEDEANANARLFAAAPQLLEGIRKARAAAASPQSFDLEEVERDFAALIARAEGGQS